MTRRYSMIYTKNSDGSEILERYDIEDGYKLFLVSATYANGFHGSKYYVIARNKVEAKRLFKSKFSWLSEIRYIDEVECETAKQILCDARHHIII